MYIQINEEKIKLDFNSGITVSVDGPDTSYYVEINEFLPNNEGVKLNYFSKNALIFENVDFLEESNHFKNTMKKFYLLLVVLLALTNSYSQEVYFLTGTNITKYNFTSQAEPMTTPLQAGTGSFYEIGYDFSLNSDALLEIKNEPEQVVKFANKIKQQAGRLNDLVQEIINLSKLQDADPMA